MNISKLRSLFPVLSNFIYLNNAAETPLNIGVHQKLNAYLEFCAKLDRIGLPKGPAQGPMDYMTDVISARKDLEDSVREIIRLYIDLRYGRPGDEASLTKFRSLVRQFKPQ